MSCMKVCTGVTTAFVSRDDWRFRSPKSQPIHNLCLDGTFSVGINLLFLIDKVHNGKTSSNSSYCNGWFDKTTRKKVVCKLVLYFSRGECVKTITPSIRPVLATNNSYIISRLGFIQWKGTS